MRLDHSSVGSGDIQSQRDTEPEGYRVGDIQSQRDAESEICRVRGIQSQRGTEIRGI